MRSRRRSEELNSFRPRVLQLNRLRRQRDVCLGLLLPAFLAGGGGRVHTARPRAEIVFHDTVAAGRV
jgi:hypothetical protein